jgi:hypothetical protein
VGLARDLPEFAQVLDLALQLAIMRIDPSLTVGW